MAVLYLLLNLRKPYLTLPDNSAFPIPKSAVGTHPSPTVGHLTPASNPDTFIYFNILASSRFFKNFPKIWHNKNSGLLKFSCAQIDTFKHHKASNVNKERIDIGAALPILPFLYTVR